MKIGGIDYGVESPWEIDVPDDAIIVENTAESRIPQRSRMSRKRSGMRSEIRWVPGPWPIR